MKMENDPLKYHILLILTDRVIDDMEETVDALVNDFCESFIIYFFNSFCLYFLNCLNPFSDIL